MDYAKNASVSYNSGALAGTEVPTTEVDGRLNELSSRLSELADLASRVEGTFRAVLTPDLQPPMPQDSGPKLRAAEGPRSDIACRLASLIESAEVTANYLRRTCGRSEL
jgi:hypothetical protein